jgi:ribose transport system substrate-binding protein
VRRIKGSLVVAGAAVAALTLAACSGNSSTTEPSAGGASQAPAEASAAPVESAEEAGPAVIIGNSDPIAANPGSQAIVHGAEVAAQALGWDYRNLDSNLSADKQVTDLNTLVNLGARGLSSWLLNPGGAGAAISAAQAKDIPVVLFNSPGTEANTDVVTALYANCDGAQQVASFVAERIPGGDVVLIGPPAVPLIQQYMGCLTDAAKAAGLNVLDQRDNVDDNAAGAQPLVQDLLTKYPDVDGVLCYNDQSCLGASAAIISTGKKVFSDSTKEGIVVGGTNGSAEAIDAIKAGRLTYSIDPNFDLHGAASIAVMDPVIQGAGTLADMPKQVIIPFTVYTDANVGDWTDPVKRSPAYDDVVALVKASK